MRIRKKVKKRIIRALIVILVAALMFGAYSCLDVIREITGMGPAPSKDPSKTTPSQSTVVSGELVINFLELGNKYTGDCVFIKAGDNDILIDAGSKTGSVPVIKEYIDQYVTDGALEYVIVTHAHEDHYAGFATSEKASSLFDLYECKTIIDFAQVTTSKVGTNMYNNYLRERDAEIANGAVHYTAKDCIDNAKDRFDLGGGVELQVLDSYYYHNRSSNENNHSVCVMINQGDRNFLFTGDLEAEGEEHLVALNELPKVELYKAGHHGSKTSSSAELLAAIKPDMVCVCCCAGSNEYTKTPENQFPTQAMIDRVAPYTNKVYVTSLMVDNATGEFTSMNGNIRVVSGKSGISVTGSNHSTPLYQTEWFKNNRVCPAAWKRAA